MSLQCSPLLHFSSAEQTTMYSLLGPEERKTSQRRIGQLDARRFASSLNQAKALSNNQMQITENRSHRNFMSVKLPLPHQIQSCWQHHQYSGPRRLGGCHCFLGLWPTGSRVQERQPISSILPIDGYLQENTRQGLYFPQITGTVIYAYVLT
jgi:hypothetical protein